MPGTTTNSLVAGPTFIEGLSSYTGKAPLLLRATVFSIFFFPSNMVMGPVGAAGTVPLMLASSMFLVWLTSAAFGLHNPLDFAHPGRIGIVLLWLGSVASYAALFSGATGGSTAVGRASADRWIILLVASAGIAFVVTESLRTLDDALVFIRALLAGALFCCLVAVYQFVTRTNPMEWIQLAMPGFTDNGGNTPFQDRGALVRVAGSTFHSIEFAVVSAMLLPLSIWRGIYDRRGRKWLHWSGTGLLVFGIASTVSRSGTLGLAVGLTVFLPFLPRTARMWAAVLVPIAVSGLFLAVPGLLGTLTSSFTAGESDPSISTRTDNFPRVAGMVIERPIVGLGPGNFTPASAIYILDNQYLNAAVTMGLVGFLCVIAYLLLPGLAALHAARVISPGPLQALAAAIAAGGLVACVCSLTFDSMSFPVFALIYPVFCGLSGVVWLLAKNEYYDNNSKSPKETD